MIQIKEFSDRKGIAEEKVVLMIRDGFYAGRKVDGQWFVDEDIESEKLRIKEPESKTRGVFFKGAMVGLGLLILFCIVSSPQNPNFEGAGGYHMLASLILTPIAMVLCGTIATICSKIMSLFS